MRDRFLLIKSDNQAVLQKGRLLQYLLLMVAFAGLANIAIIMASQLSSHNIVDYRPLYLRTPIVLLFTILCLWLIRNGRIRLAAHLFSGGLNLIFLTVFITVDDRSVAMMPYLMLIGIVAIAALDSVPASMKYATFFVTAVIIFQIISSNFNRIDIVTYVIAVLSISVSFWITARDLKQALLVSDQLAQEIQSKNSLLQRRARQLQLSAEVIQQTSHSLDIEKLLHSTVHLVREQFGFYHVSLFLLNETKQALYLYKATGEIGQQLQDQAYTIPIKQDSIISWVAQNQKARVVAEVEHDSIYQNEPLLSDTKSELALPLATRGTLVGVLDVQSRTPNAFHEEDIAILQIMANQVATNIDNAHLFARTEARLNETKTLYDLNSVLTTTLDLGEIYRRAAREFTRNLDITRCAISSWNKEKNVVKTEAEYVHDKRQGLVNEYDTEYEMYDLDNHPQTVHVLNNHAPIVRRLDDSTLSDPEKGDLKEMKQTICLEVALVFGVQALGIVELYRDETQPDFSVNEIQLVQTMANQTAVSLNNAILSSNTRGQLAQISSLHRLSSTLSLAPSLKELYSGTRREILSMIEATGMSISLLTENREMIDWVYGYEFGQNVDLSQLPQLSISEGFMGYVARTGETLCIESTPDILEQYSSFNVGIDQSHWLGLPLIAANNLIGVLAVENDVGFSPREIDLLTTMSGPIAIAINNLIQFEKVQQALVVQSEQRIQLQTAAEVAASATSVMGVSELLQNTVELIRERFDLYYVGLFLVDEAGNQAILRAGTGMAGQAQISEKHQLTIGGKSLIGGATADGKSRIIQDVQTDEEWLPNKHMPATRSELAIPLRVRKHVIGALTVQSKIPNVFSPDLVKTMQTMSDQLAVAIQNAQLLSWAEEEAYDQQQIQQISSQLYQSVDVNQIVSIGLQAISQRLGGSKVNLLLGSQQNNNSEAREDNNEQ